MPLVKQKAMGFRFYLEAARKSLLKGRRARRTGRDRIHAAVGHAPTFSTWRSLAVEQGLGGASCVDLMFIWIARVEANSQ